MASDIIQRAAAICGIDNPNSDQLAAWLSTRATEYAVEFDRRTPSPTPYSLEMGDLFYVHSTMLSVLAAAVVEVDRIERESKKP